MWKLWTSVSIWKRTLVGIFLGIGLGFFFQDAAIMLKPLGDTFLSLLKMILIPLVFISLLNSIINVKKVSSLGQMTLKAMLWIVGTTALSVVLGIFVAIYFQPGKGMTKIPSFNNSTTPIVATSTENNTPTAQPNSGKENTKLPTLADPLSEVIPSNMIMAFAEGKILQIIFLSVIIGLAIRTITADKTSLYQLVDNANDIINTIIRVIIEFAPIGVFSLLAYTTALFGSEVLIQSAKIIAIVVIMYAFQLFVIFPIILKVKGHNVRDFFSNSLDALVMAVATNSSNATLPTTFACAKKMGINKGVRSFILPLGATLNMNGAGLYQAIFTIFAANIFQVPLDLTSYLLIFGTTMISSIGTAGVPGGGLATVQLILVTVGIPIEALVFFVAIDRLIGTLQTPVNIGGDLMVASIISKEMELKELVDKS
ncbi:Dicarboxylate/amino acid:cation symporter [Candidatus Hepatincolaceae symbiont of Richtersius coronifer]